MITALAISYVIAEGVGPFIGGAFNEHLSWRWCFYINLPIGAFAFIILAFCNTSGEPHQKMWLPSKIKKIMNYDYGELLKASFWKNTFEVLVFKLDMVGIILSSAGFTLLMLGLSFGGNNFPWNSAYISEYTSLGTINSSYDCNYGHSISKFKIWHHQTGNCFGVLCGIVGSGLFTLINGELSQSIGYSILPGIAFGSIFQATLLSSQVQITSDDPDFQNKFIEVTAFNSFAKSLGFAFGGIWGQ
ncbi:ATM_1a_G0025760.mRNA.1.CDS.1 [Saccharomyces cerevisiae]|nr:ATM_1a_G0025760.mRNA.1.CDS.1 [Saccharomyces cerevisiae]CAI7166715.1 ATM_1a_G0025760.mRNA.1.CDS.1 [Saccharomyces cerevisiae]